MLEDFLQGIYNKAFSLDLLKKISFYSGIRHTNKCFEFWNNASNILNDIVNDISKSDPQQGRDLLDQILKARNGFSDLQYFSGIIDRDVIPAISNYLSKFTGINVTQGKWTLESSDTGFLTVRCNDGSYVHNPFDPMWESFLFSYSIYKPEVQRYNILGGGLGYPAYQLWQLSNGEADIYIYEIDDDISLFADLYGVISYIDKEKIHIIRDDNKDNVIERYFEDGKKPNAINKIYYWDSSSYDGVYSDKILISYSNEYTEKVFDQYWKANYVRNRLVDHKMISEFDTSVLKEEWVIVGAGPSLNDNEDFLRESSGKRTICAVNTSLKWFYHHSIIPNMCTVYDPLNDLVSHIEGIEEFTSDVPLVADCIANHHYVELYKGPKYYVYSRDSQRIAPNDMDNSNLWTFGGTVVSMAIETAFRMGAKRIYLVGVDLGYPGGVTYAEEVGHKSEKYSEYSKTDYSVERDLIPTSVQFYEYKIQIEHQIKSHPDTEVINKSLHGVYINGAFCNQWWENIPRGSECQDYLSLFRKLKDEKYLLSWKRKYFIFWQILQKMESYGVIINSDDELVIRKAYDYIYQEFKNALDWNAPNEVKYRKRQTYIFTSVFDERESESAKVLNTAYLEANNMHNVFIVNTAEKMGGELVAIHNRIECKYNKTLEKADKVLYRNINLPYFQFPEGMPEISFYTAFLNSVADNAPDRILVARKYSLLADCFSEGFNIPIEYID